MFQQPRYNVAKDRYQKKIWEDDQLKAPDNYVKAGGSGALIGSLIRNKGTSAKKAAAIGAAVGVGSQMLVRRVSSGTKDQFGERSHAGKRVDGALPLAGEVGGAVLGYRMAAKKMKRFGFSEGSAISNVGKIARNTEWGRIGRSAAVGAAALGGAGALAGAMTPDKGTTSGQSAANGLVKDGIFGAALYGVGEPLFKKMILKKGEQLFSSQEPALHCQKRNKFMKTRLVQLGASMDAVLAFASPDDENQQGVTAGGLVNTAATAGALGAGAYGGYKLGQFALDRLASLRAVKPGFSAMGAMKYLKPIATGVEGALASKGDRILALGTKADGILSFESRAKRLDSDALNRHSSRDEYYAHKEHSPGFVAGATMGSAAGLYVGSPKIRKAVNAVFEADKSNSARIIRRVVKNRFSSNSTRIIEMGGRLDSMLEFAVPRPDEFKSKFGITPDELNRTTKTGEYYERPKTTLGWTAGGLALAGAGVYAGSARVRKAVNSGVAAAKSNSARIIRRVVR